MATNRWYDNTTNILVDFTRANVSDIENKCDDIADGLDALEIEYDALISGTIGTLNSQALRVTAEYAAATLTTALTAAQRAEGILGFDENGDLEVKTLGDTEALDDSFTVVTGAGTLAVGGAYYVQAGSAYTLTLPVPTQAGQSIKFSFDGQAEANNITIDGGALDVAGDDTLIVDCNHAHFILIYDGSEWGL